MDLVASRTSVDHPFAQKVDQKPVLLEVASVAFGWRRFALDPFEVGDIEAVEEVAGTDLDPENLPVVASEAGLERKTVEAGLGPSSGVPDSKAAAEESDLGQK